MIAPIVGIVKWFLGPVGRFVGLGIVIFALLASFRSCILQHHEDQAKVKVAEQSQKIVEKDKEDEEKLDQTTDDEFAEYMRSGRLPERLRNKH